MFKHTAKLLALLFVIASIVLFISCQEQQSIVAPDSGQTNLAKISADTLFIPAGATVTSAKLFIYQIYGPVGQSVNAHRITSDWPCEVTWATFGGAYDAGVINSFYAAEGSWRDVDITTLVQAWMNGTYTNYGILLDEPSFLGNSKFHSTENATNMPYFEVVLSTGDTIDVTPSVDTWIWEADPTSEACTDEYLFAGYYADPTIGLTKQTLIRFPIEVEPVTVCETAYAYGDVKFCGLPGIQSNNWGWTRTISGTFFDDEIPIYAGAAHCDPENGMLVGTLSIDFDATTNELEVDYDMDPEYTVGNVHMWIGDTYLPVNKQGKYKAAPGQYNHNNETFPFSTSAYNETFYIAVHFDVCWEE